MTRAVLGNYPLTRAARLATVARAGKLFVSRHCRGTA